MATNVPPMLSEYILGAPEVTLVERALAAAMEQAGRSADDVADLRDTGDLDPLSAAYLRWERHVRGLESPRYVLPVDGYGLAVVVVPVEDIPILIMALKARVFDLEEEAAAGIEYDYRDMATLCSLVSRFEGLLR